MRSKKKPEGERDISKLTGTEKAAIILLTMNQENSARIFASLSQEEIKEISMSMVALGNVANEIIDKVITEFKLEVTERLSVVGNLDTTQKLLESIFGKEKVEIIMEDIKGPLGKNTWDKLTNVNEELLASYLKNEYPQTIALISSKISPKTAAKVLSMLPEELTFEVIMRMLNLDSVKKEVLEKIENTLRTDFISTISKVQKRDSHELIAEIFNNFDRNNEVKYMGILESKVPEHAEKVKELMFTFDDLVKLQPSDIATVVKFVDKNKLTLALKGANQDIRNLFTNNMSQRAAKILIEDMEAMGPVRLKDVDEAQAMVITSVKELINTGEITITSGGEGEEFIQ